VDQAKACRKAKTTEAKENARPHRSRALQPP
jgi:hypothetical protein